MTEELLMDGMHEVVDPTIDFVCDFVDADALPVYTCAESGGIYDVD